MSSLTEQDSAEAAPSPEASNQLKAADLESVQSSPAGDVDLVLEDLLVEDVSIDGMCGVY